MKEEQSLTVLLHDCAACRCWHSVAVCWFVLHFALLVVELQCNHGISLTLSYDGMEQLASWNLLLTGLPDGIHAPCVVQFVAPQRNINFLTLSCTVLVAALAFNQ